MTFKEFIASSCQIALSGGDANQSQFLDMEMTAEALVPTVFQNVALAAAANPDKQSLLRRTHTVTLTAGVGTLPGEVLTQCLHSATLTDPDDDTVAQDMSYVPQWFDFLEAKRFEPRLGYWNVKGDDELHYIRPTDDSETKTGDVDITVASVPAIPATAGAVLVVPDEILSDLQAALANAIRAKGSV